MNDYPAMIAAANHVEPVPRRVRAFLAGEKVFDTTRALYVWEWPNYPQYYIRVAVTGQLEVRLACAVLSSMRARSYSAWIARARPGAPSRFPSLAACSSCRHASDSE